MRVTFLTLLFGASLLFPVQGFTQSPDTLFLNLSSSINRAVAVSPEIAASQESKNYALARYRLAMSSRFLTEFSATTAHAPVPGLTNPNEVPTNRLYLDPDVTSTYDKIRIFNRLEAELIQPIYTWGELGGNIAAARLGVGVEDSDVNMKREEVALRTGELYYSLLLANELFRIVDDTRDIVEQAKSEIRRMIDEGSPDVDDADLYQVLITEQEFRRRVVEVEQKRATAEMALSRQILAGDDVRIITEDTVLEPIPFIRDSLNVYQDLAILHRPELQKAEDGFAARDALVRVARSDYYPKLFLGARFNVRTAPGRYEQDGPFHSDRFQGESIEAGIGLRQKLNFFQTKAKVEQAEAQRNEVEHQRRAAEQLILFEVENAYRNLAIAESALESQNEALRISREWLQLESINFDLDLGDTENLVKAVRANLELQAEAQQAVQQYNVAVLRLLNTTGTLSSQIASGTLVVQ